MKKINVAVVGATGTVGETLLAILQERQFPVDTLFPLASADSVGKVVQFNGRSVRVKHLAEFDFSQVDLALFSAGGTISAEYAPIAAEHAVVIDNASYFRNMDGIPLIIPEVNPQDLDTQLRRGIIANPNCSTIQMLVAINPIHQRVGLTRVNVATYQAVSGSGKAAIDELARQCRQLLNGEECVPDVYSQQIAFNLIPHIDEFENNGYTREEMKMVNETRKILGDTAIEVNPTAVRVPVFYGHSEAIHLETKHKMRLEQAKACLQNAPGVTLFDGHHYPTPISDASGKDSVFVGRLREDISSKNGLNLWVVADNIRKGAALNAVQIAEMLFKS